MGRASVVILYNMKEVLTVYKSRGKLRLKRQGILQTTTFDRILAVALVILSVNDISPEKSKLNARCSD